MEEWRPYGDWDAETGAWLPLARDDDPDGGGAGGDAPRLRNPSWLGPYEWLPERGMYDVCTTSRSLAEYAARRAGKVRGRRRTDPCALAFDACPPFDKTLSGAAGPFKSIAP